jgi:type VI protein secretion system component VasF
MLGFRGEGPGKPETLASWCEGLREQLAKQQNRAWPGLPAEQQPQGNSMPRRTRERLRRILIGVTGILAVLIPLAMYILVSLWR